MKQIISNICSANILFLLFSIMQANENIDNKIIDNKEQQTNDSINAPYPTTSATKQLIADSKRYYANIKEDEGRVYSISMRADGFIQQLFVERSYMSVKKSQPLFSFYSPDFIDAQSEFLAQRAHSHLAKQKLELLGIHNIEIKKIESTQQIRNDIVFYAPFNGVVFVKNVNRGSGVKKGDEVFRIVNLDSVWVIANINQEDINFAKRDDIKAFFQLEGSAEKFPLNIDKIYPNVVDNFVQMRFNLSNPNAIFFPNAFGYVFIESAPKERLVLSKNAVLFKNNKFFVFVYEDEEFMPKEIKAKKILGSAFYEILDGLEEGDMVAKDALFILDSDALNNGDF